MPEPAAAGGPSLPNGWQVGQSGKVYAENGTLVGTLKSPTEVQLPDGRIYRKDPNKPAGQQWGFA
jgi:hypothetical protein